eukprot:GFYU01000183.1.p1 GENE.GFYU01000183.1~~GFYU01000183.1.p1  ORF type:complete len:1042 (-),score=289.47 GFYU01000183.1:66-3191(-)
MGREVRSLQFVSITQIVTLICDVYRSVFVFNNNDTGFLHSCTKHPSQTHRHALRMGGFDDSMLTAVDTGARGEQCMKIKNHVDNERMTIGDTYYLVSSRWVEQWNAYSGFGELQGETSFVRVPKPGPIDNSELLESDEENLKPGLSEQEDYYVVSSPVWTLFSTWYGGGPVIERYVIARGVSKTPSVEVYPIRCTVHRLISETDERCTLSISLAASVGDLKFKVCSVMDLMSQYTRLWHVWEDDSLHSLHDENITLEEAQLEGQSVVILCQETVDGEFPAEPPTWPKSGMTARTTGVQPMTSSESSLGGTSGSSLALAGSTTELSSRGLSNRLPGNCGLSNLGNTCFMNSSLQCLSHSKYLKNYFVSNRYLSQINKTNPLGMKGQLAEEFGELLKVLWSGDHDSFSPRQFKWKVGQFAPQFSGYSQHDSQELLAFLLDGLHEDLNLVQDKPYTEAVEAKEGEADDSVATRSWDTYLMRNKSVIVDMFQGQYKSTLVCPTCKKVSITFDPFMYLSVPLPVKNERTIHVSVMKLDGSTPVRYPIDVSKAGQMEDLRKSLADKCGIDKERLVLTEVYNFRFYRVYINNSDVEAIRDNDVIVAYETHVNTPLPAPVASRYSYSYQNTETIPESVTVVRMLHRMPSTRERYHGGRLPPSVVGRPLLMTFDASEPTTNKRLYVEVFTMCKRFMSQDAVTAMESKLGLQGADPMDFVMVKEATTASSNSDDIVEISTEAAEEDEAGTVVVESAEKTVSEDDGNSKLHPGMPFTLLYGDSEGRTEQDVIPVDGEKATLRTDKGDHIEKLTILIDWNQAEFPDVFDEKLEDKEEKFLEPEKEKLSAINVEKCFDLFTSTEELDEDNTWYCSHCKEFQLATKKIDLWKLPHYLVVHLKRFSYSRRYRDKIDLLVEAPLVGLDLSKYELGQDESAVYDLYAVSNHFGGMGGGHYTAHCLAEDANWYTFDDSFVSKTDASRVVSSSSYLLFYQRRAEPTFKTSGGPPPAATAPAVPTPPPAVTPVSPSAEQSDDKTADEPADGTGQSVASLAA